MVLELVPERAGCLALVLAEYLGPVWVARMALVLAAYLALEKVQETAAYSAPEKVQVKAARTVQESVECSGKGSGEV